MCKFKRKRRYTACLNMKMIHIIKHERRQNLDKNEKAEKETVVQNKF